MKIHEEYLKQSMDRLTKLKTNIHVPFIVHFVDVLRENWKPQTKTISGQLIHGSKKGDEEMLVLYYDEYNHSWTTEDIAFRGHVFVEIAKIIKTEA